MTEKELPLVTLSETLDGALAQHYHDASPGIAVSVSQQGKTVYERCLGLANASTGKKIDTRSNFRMASVSKQFTAMAVALLERAGQLSFQSRLSDLLPELGLLGNQITVHHLLTHTSGLYDYEDAVDFARPDQVTDAEVLQIITAVSGTYFQPGSQFRYSNTGYVLLGLLIEKVAHKPFAEFLREQIFAPLGMSNTTLYSVTNPQHQIPNRALGYTRDEKGGFYLSDQSPCSATQGDGCIYTSLQEYQLWHKALFSADFLHLELLLNKSHAAVEQGKNWYYGMGWFFAKRKDESLELYHTGNSSGFSHLVVSIPAGEVLITAFSNIADNSHLLPGLLQTVLQETSFQLESNLVWQLPNLTR
ncbi:serine hydrolase domain-containing protein [Sabulibacter ruber]|uniref:serine hydrolase domain-containing protein n=1 Tax=Sabulibacter ruber TaxID=2811901 RepID=UPI001A971ACB|nr:serine hydrolase domain-containing protein [Sabulibacter ruber]